MNRGTHFVEDAQGTLALQQIDYHPPCGAASFARPPWCAMSR